MLRIIFIYFILILILNTAFIPDGYAKENKLYIGILPYYAPDKIWHIYKPFLDYLNKETSLRWDLKLYHNYKAFINGICKKEVSIAYLGPVPFALAYERCKIRPLLVVLGDDGRPFYHSIIFTNNHKIKSIKELRGKSFAFGEKESTSSYIVPLMMLEKEGLTIDMIKPLFMTSHEKIIKAVISNKADAGVTKSSVFEKFKELKLKVLKVSDPIPHHSFCAINLRPDIEKRFIKALLKLKPMENAIDQKTVKYWDPELQYGFILPPDDYIPNVLKLGREKVKYYRGLLNDG